MLDAGFMHELSAVGGHTLEPAAMMVRFSPQASEWRSGVVAKPPKGMKRACV